MKVLMDDHGGDDDHDGHDYDKNGYDLVSDPVPSFPSVLKVNDKWMGLN